MTETPNIGANFVGQTDTLAYSPTEALQRVFGGEARFAPSDAMDGVVSALGGESLADNWVVRTLLLALFVSYMAAMLFYGGHIRGMWKIVVGRNIGIKVADELSYLFVRAMLLFCSIGVVAISLSVVNILNIVGVSQVEGVGLHWTTLVVILAMLGVVLIAKLLTEAICLLVKRGEVAQGLGIISCAVVGLMSVVGTPCVLLFAINDGLSAHLVGAVLVVVVAIGILTYVIKSFIFFVEQKISILLWFLYLCTVVLIPLGVVVTTLVRNSSI